MILFWGILLAKSTQCIGDSRGPLGASHGIPIPNPLEPPRHGFDQVRSLGSAKRFDPGILKAPWAVFPKTKRYRREPVS